MSDAQYREGGGDLPVYQEDFFQRIVNVQWTTGAVVVVGDNQGFAYYGELTSKDSQKWIEMPNLNFGGGSSDGIVGAAYALVGKKSVFVLVGATTNDINNPSFNNTTRAIAMTSSDGKFWNTTYDNPEYIGSTVPGSISDEWEIIEAVVWDDQAGAFYFSSLAIREIFGTGFSATTRLYRSPDGNSWSQTNSDNWISQPTDGSVWGPFASMILPHCRKPQNRNQIPDGLQGYDKKKGTFMKPQDLLYILPGETPIYNNSPPASVVFVDPKTGGSRSANVSGPCYCVGGVNGIWLAGGGVPTMLVSSFDDGKTWGSSGTRLEPGNKITAIIAASKSEVK